VRPMHAAFRSQLLRWWLGCTPNKGEGGGGVSLTGSGEAAVR
jgi:hypothetical protein